MTLKNYLIIFNKVKSPDNPNNINKIKAINGCLQRNTVLNKLKLFLQYSLAKLNEEKIHIKHQSDKNINTVLNIKYIIFIIFFFLQGKSYYLKKKFLKYLM